MFYNFSICNVGTTTERFVRASVPAGFRNLRRAAKLRHQQPNLHPGIRSVWRRLWNDPGSQRSPRNRQHSCFHGSQRNFAVHLWSHAVGSCGRDWRSGVFEKINLFLIPRSEYEDLPFAFEQDLLVVAVFVVKTSIDFANKRKRQAFPVVHRDVQPFHL
jgi:hypothetical protein